MKRKHYQSLGIGLFSSLLLLTQQVLAEEITTPPTTPATDAVATTD